MNGLKALEHMNKNIILCEDIDEDVEIIEKELEALKIVKEKRVNVDNFLNHIEKDTDYKEYIRLYGLYKITVFSDKVLTREEYDLLKEVLTDGD